jgi:hypothetical protein
VFFEFFTCIFELFNVIGYHFGRFGAFFLANGARLDKILSSKTDFQITFCFKFRNFHFIFKPTDYNQGQNESIFDILLEKVLQTNRIAIPLHRANAKINHFESVLT